MLRCKFAEISMESVSVCGEGMGVCDCVFQKNVKVLHDRSLIKPNAEIEE